MNLRYVLMSFSLSQRLDPSIGTLRHLAVGYGITDEIHALAMTRPVVRFALAVLLALRGRSLITVALVAAAGVWVTELVAARL
ncbi:MAG: AzlC family ABC transporter permease [Actinomycetota bacterium]